MIALVSNSFLWLAMHRISYLLEAFHCYIFALHVTENFYLTFQTLTSVR